MWRYASHVDHGSRICKSSPTITEEEAIKFVCETLDTAELEPKAIREAIRFITVERGAALTPDMQQSKLDELTMGSLFRWI